LRSPGRLRLPSISQYLKHAVAVRVLDAAISTIPAFSRGPAPWGPLNISGDGDFVAVGDENAENIIGRTGLAAGQSVLEIGSGVGRNAGGLFRRLGNRIEYTGFDIMRFAVTWSRKHFGRAGALYRFEHADLYNSLYNPFGKIPAGEYRFPARSSSVDLAFAVSVLTHMQAGDIEHYVAEIGRVLKPGGKLYVTGFFLDDAAREQIAKGAASFSFSHPAGECRIEETARPDKAVAQPFEWLEALLERSSLSITSLDRSNWRGVEAPLFQDVLLATRA
jgi:SAM-dependent methyltransferase